MKALTILQPYAHLIVRGEKLVENREWPTRYRGALAIHAGKSRDWINPYIVADFAEKGDPIVFGAVAGNEDDLKPHGPVGAHTMDKFYGAARG